MTEVPVVPPGAALAAAVSGAPTPFRAPPHDLRMEQALLGTLMLGTARVDAVAEVLRPEHFADPVHGRIFTAMLALDERGVRPDPRMLANFFTADAGLAEIGGAPYLAALEAAVVGICTARQYAELVRDLADRREMIGACLEALDRCYAPQPDHPAAMVAETLESALMTIAADAARGGRPLPPAETMGETLARVEALYRGDRAMIGLPTGFDRLDDKIRGLEPGNLYLLGGRPSMGKSVLGENIARHVAGLPAPDGDKPGAVALFSLEMTRDQVNQRGLAATSGIPFHAIRDGRLSAPQFDTLLDAARRMRDLPLYVDDTPGLGIGAIRARARRLRRRGGVRLVVVDHLHLVAGAARAENRNLDLATITRSAKALAKELDTPVLLLAQLSRAVEQREDKRPQLSDLRESGAIEQDADTVMFVFREQYYLERGEPYRRADESDDRFAERHGRWSARCAECAGRGEIIIAKQRNGPVGTVPLAFDGEFQRFRNLPRENGGGDEGRGDDGRDR